MKIDVVAALDAVRVDGQAVKSNVVDSLIDLLIVRFFSPVFHDFTCVGLLLAP